MSQKASNPEIRATGDGSTSLYSPAFDQLYHNPNGAVAESRHVFFDTSGLTDAIQSYERLTLFETGFGTGLNLLLVLDLLEKTNSACRVDFYSVEAFPIRPELVNDFAFNNESGLTGSLFHLRQIFERIEPGLNRFVITKQLTLYLFYGTFDAFFEENRELTHLPNAVDFFLHDPFSPDKNPELWTPDVFEKLMEAGSSSCMLSTYCAASSARAALAVAGWKVARARGALGKREMTVASPDPERLDEFKRVNEKRLAERYRRGDFM